MTIRDILAAMGRRWYVIVVTVATAALLLVVFARAGGVYTTKTVVTFLLPYATSLSPNNGADDYSVITFARSVAAQVNAGRHPVAYSTDDAPYYGAGLREGVLVVVPNDGNQWYKSYSRAEIDIEIVGPTEAWVREQQTTYVQAIIDTARTQQTEIAPHSTDYVTASVVPLTLSIGKVTATRGAQLQALGAMALAVLIASAWGAVALDRRLIRRRAALAGPDRPRKHATWGGAST